MVLTPRPEYSQGGVQNRDSSCGRMQVLTVVG